MKIFLNFEDIKQLIFDSYNGVKEVSVEDEEVEFLLNVDGDNFYRNKEENLKNNVQTIEPVVIEQKDSTPAKKSIIKPGESVDYDTLIQKKPLVDSGVHPPKEKTIEEKNEEAIQKGLMTTGRGSSRALRKF